MYVGSNISLPSTLILEAVLFLHSVKLPTKGTQLQIVGGLFHYNFIACLQYLLLLSHYVFVIVISYFECSQFATNTGEMQIRVVLAVVVGHGGIFFSNKFVMDNMLNIILVMMVFHLQHILSDQKTIYNNCM